MLSMLDAVSFSFRKVHIFIWGILLCLFYSLGHGIQIFNEDFYEVLKQIKTFSIVNPYIWENFLTNNVVLGTVLFSCIFSWILIQSVKNAYSLDENFSVFSFLKTFIFLFCIFEGIFYLKEYWNSFLTGYPLLLEYQHSDSQWGYLLSEFIFFFLTFLIISPFFLAFIMYLSGENYFYSLGKTLKHFFFSIHIFSSIISLCIFLILPLKLIEYAISHMDIQSVLSYAHNPESGSVLALFALMLIIGVPTGYFIWFSNKGRFFILISTIFFIWMCGVVSLHSEIEFSFTLSVYFYLTWLLVSFHISTLVLFIPVGILNTLAQGSFEIHSKFNKYVANPGLFRKNILNHHNH